MFENGKQISPAPPHFLQRPDQFSIFYLISIKSGKCPKINANFLIVLQIFFIKIYIFSLKNIQNISKFFCPRGGGAAAPHPLQESCPSLPPDSAKKNFLATPLNVNLTNFRHWFSNIVKKISGAPPRNPMIFVSFDFPFGLDKTEEYLNGV